MQAMIRLSKTKDRVMQSRHLLGQSRHTVITRVDDATVIRLIRRCVAWPILSRVEIAQALTGYSTLAHMQASSTLSQQTRKPLLAFVSTATAIDRCLLC